MAYEVKNDSKIQLKGWNQDPDFRKRLHEAIQTVLWEVRNRASEDISYYIHDSAHEAYRAVHHSVYQHILGGNVNILTQRKALRMGHVAPSWRGRSGKTEKMLSYVGADRGMILRWINQGTKNRWTVRMDGHPMYRNSTAERPKNRKYVFPNKLGGRGGAATRRTRTIGMFDKVVDYKMVNAEKKLQILIDEIIKDML